jgi:hypothetical protein
MSDQTQGQVEQVFASNGSSEVVTVAAENMKNDSMQKPDLGAINRERQIKVWADRVEKGEVSVDELPEGQEWLKPLVAQEIQTRASANDIDAIVERKLAEAERKRRLAEEENRFKQLQKKAQTLDIEESDKQMIQDGYARLVSKGMGHADALEESLAIFEALQKGGEATIQEMKKRMEIPVQTKKVDDSEPEFGTEEFAKKGTPEQRIAKMEALLSQRTGLTLRAPGEGENRRQNS